MGNERRLRLIQAAKEFKVGLNTITDFLQKKGIKCDGANSLVDEATYAILEKEYGSNRAAAGARDSVRERISQKQTSVSLDGTKQKEEEKEVVIKSNMIHVKDEIQQPKFLGKIDLDAKKPEIKKVEEAPKVVEQPKQEAPKVVEQPKPVVEAPKVVEKPVEQPKQEEKPAEQKTVEIGRAHV